MEINETRVHRTAIFGSQFKAQKKTPDEEASLYETLCILRKRIIRGAEFPHEIGLFLSYPPEDVRGFIENRAQNFKRAGLWKVYGDEARAEALFRKFKKCTQIYCERWQSGSKMDELAVAV